MVRDVSKAGVSREMKPAPDETSTAAEHSLRHRAGSAWTDLGTQRLISNRFDWESSVLCHKRAVELLGGLPVHEDASYLADLGAAWMNLGCALLAGPSSDSFREALDALDRGVDLLGRLPFESNSRYRHNVAAAWMNRAEAFAMIDTRNSQINALESFGRAIETAGGLPLDEKPSFRILLASCWINTGNLHQRLLRIPEAINAYESAVEALGTLPSSGHRMACHHAATAWINRGEALHTAGDARRPEDAVESAQSAFGHIEGRNLGCSVDAKLSVRALRVMARGVETLFRRRSISGADGIARLTDLAERGLDLAFGGHEVDPGFFDPFILWFFSFGGRIYGLYQPQFLAEFLNESLNRWNPEGDSRVGRELLLIAGQSRSAALEVLGRARLLAAGSLQTELLMRTVTELRTLNFQSNP
jgi:tetratricopeptide (TPR) repeat protein